MSKRKQADVLFNETLNKVIEKSKINNEEEIQRKFSVLLKYSKVIRDPVQGDIWITETEKEIIDTPIFQRLRRIKQLGPTDFVYPSAKHTRFEHSIGTLYMAQQIIDHIYKNFELGLSKLSLTKEDIFITRVVALMHDLAHLPYGHTIEDEGNLFGSGNKQWLDNERRQIILKEVFPIVENQLRNVGIPEDRIKRTLEDIEKILIAEELGEDKIHDLNSPYIADIVGNTICADLLDYLKRDSYNTGLKMAYDPRILSYFVIYPYSYEKNGENKPEKPRVAILLERRKGTLRKDILSECIELLRLRYSLAEKVYYHRVKTFFSAIVIKMVYCGLKGGIFKKDDLLWLSDDALLYRIISYPFSEDEHIRACKYLTKALLERKKYCKIYDISYKNERLWNMVKDYTDPDKRYLLEKQLEDLFGFPPGAVVVYSPKLDKGKAAETKTIRGLFEGDPIIKKLLEMGKEPDYKSTIGQELSTIENFYEKLWKFYVLIDSEWGNKRDKELLKCACDEILQGTVGECVIKIRLEINGIEITNTQLKEAKRQIVEIDPREIKGKKIDEILRSIKGVSNV